MRTLRSPLVALAAVALTACGGGDSEPDGWTGAQRTCAGPFVGDAVAVCTLDVEPRDTDRVLLTAEALMRAHNGTRDVLRFKRFSMVRFGGDAYGYVTDEFDLQPGESRTVTIRASAEVPVANGGYPPVETNFSSYDQSEESAIESVRITVEPR